MTTEARKEVLDFTKGIAITTIQEGKACLSDGNIQSCLSTCGLADFTGPVAPTCKKKLARDRAAFYDADTNTVVIYDARSDDFGTAFRPNKAKEYFANLK